jgi:glycosyltransferase involved in cell wall biosynthesis
VRDFRAAIPHAEVHVFDNASNDATAKLAAEAGAEVHFVPFRGKGHVMRTIFRTLDADGIVVVDGDDTYPAASVHELLAPILEGSADMVVATRLEEFKKDSFRPFHVVGNKLIKNAINTLFGVSLRDILSGYRAFSARFASTCPVLSSGFEIETELTVHAVERNMVIAEVSVPYRERPADSQSKLRTFRDGTRVLLTIFKIYRDFKPLLLFGTTGVIAIAAGLLMGISVIEEFQQLNRVVGSARAALSVGLCVFGAICLTTGFTLDSVNRRARELFMLMSDQIIARRRSGS